MKIKILLAVIVLVASFIIFRLISKPLEIPKVNINKYWGPGDVKDYVENTAIRPLKVMYERDTINELRRILDRPLDLQEPLEGMGFQYGFNSKHMRPLIDYWRSIYLPKWKDRQEYLNQFKHYMTQINGLHIHFIHEKPHEIPPAVGYIRIPVLLLHGWPGSVREFYDFIPKLLSYSDDHIYGFDVVAPSLVGFGFSSAASKKGFNTCEMAIVMRKLMLRLGYGRFIVQGGDLGAAIASEIATLFPENVMGYHSNLCVMKTPLSIIKSLIANIYPPLFVAKEHEPYHFPLKEKFNVLLQESGYFHLQATKPDTLGIALAANPVGLVAYILEKFSTGTRYYNRDLEDGGLFNMRIDMDAMLDNIMLYYLPNKITSSMRFYAESMSEAQTRLQIDRVQSQVHMGCIRFKHDLLAAFDWPLRDKFPNLIHSTYSDRGGHFAALEVPEVLHEDFIVFVKRLCSVIVCKK